MPQIDLLIGPLIQCCEAATLGMPFEVWKTRMGSNRTESTMQAFGNIYKKGGPAAFWAGLGPKMFESASKGMILMYAKEGINESLLASGMNPTSAGILAGAGGGIAQVSVMGPCTYLVTGAVNDPATSVLTRVKQTYKRGGVAGFYPGGTAIAFRQATNWASRQGFTEFVRARMKIQLHGDQHASLTKTEEILAGVIGGTLACWNHPFEVARIEAQVLGNLGKPVPGMTKVMRDIIRVDGVQGLFRGVAPRIGLGIWQTLFMVTGAKLIKDEMRKRGLITK